VVDAWFGFAAVLVVVAMAPHVSRFVSALFGVGEDVVVAGQHGEPDWAAALRRDDGIKLHLYGKQDARLAREAGAADGFRTIINNGRVGHQEVYHVHMHVLGGPDPLGPMLQRSFQARK